MSVSSFTVADLRQMQDMKREEAREHLYALSRLAAYAATKLVAANSVYQNADAIRKHYEGVDKCLDYAGAIQDVIDAMESEA